MPLRIHLLGSPRLERDGHAARLDGRKTWWLLAYLLLDGRAPTRREIAERFWPDAADPLGAARWTLSQVRRALAPEADVIERSGRLRVAGAYTCDALELLEGRWDEDTVDDLAGELLGKTDVGAPAHFDTWLAIQRARIGTAAQHGIRSCAAALVRRDPIRALRLAERGLAIEPFDDALHELVVECHVGSGELEAARRYAARVERSYRDELGGEAPARLRRPLERVSASAPRLTIPATVEARALLEAARARMDAAAWADARRSATRAIDAAERTGDRALEVRAIITFLNIATCQTGRGRSEWDPLLQRAFILANEVEDPKLRCEVEIERGRLAAIEARYGTAEASLHRALESAKELEDPLLIATARRLLGLSETERCDHAAAEADLRAAMECPERRNAARAFLARLLVRADRWDEANEIGEECARDLVDDIVWAPLGLIQTGEVRLARGDLEAAGERFATALAVSRETGDVDWQVLALRGLAHVDRRDGRPERAVATMRDALQVATTHPGCRRWCEALILTDLVEWDAADGPQAERATALTRSGPMPDLAARLLAHRPGHTLLHTVTS